MRPVLDIAVRDLRSRLRDRSAWIVAFVAPLSLAVILSLALGQSDGEVTISLATADEDGAQVGALVTGLARDLTGQVIDEVVEADHAAAVRALVQAGEVDAGIVVPADTSAKVTAGEPTEVTVVRQGPGVAGDVAAAIANGASAQIERGSRAVELAVRAEAATPEAAGALVVPALDAPPVLALVDDPVEGSLANAASYFGPAMAVFFVFFVVAAGPQSVIAQRKNGTLARLAAAPIPRTAVLWGTALSVAVLAFVCIATLWLVMTVAFGASWGPPVGVIALAAAITVAAAAITMLIATFARSEEQVNGWTSVVVFTLALLGGSFGPLPPALEPVSLATPNGLALRGFVDLAAGGGLGVIVGPVLGVLVFAAVALAVAVPRAGRLVQP